MTPAVCSAARAAVFAALASAASSCLAADAGEPIVLTALVHDAPAPDRTFAHKFGEQFLDEYWQLYPDRGVLSGYFKYADRLVVPDDESRARQLGLLNKWISQLRRFDPRDLTGNGLSDWMLLSNEFEAERWAIADLREWEWNPALYDIARPIEVILHTNYASPEQRLRAVLKRLENTCSYYAAAQSNIRNPTREHVRLAIERSRMAIALLDSDLQKRIDESQLRDNEKAMFARRVLSARNAIEGYIAWLEQADKGMKDDTARSFRLGPELYGRKFTYSMQTGVTAAALYERALQEKQRLHERMESLAVALWTKYMPDRPQPRSQVDRIDWVVTSLLDHKIVTPQDVANRTSGVTRSAFLGEQPVSLVRRFFGNSNSDAGWTRYSELMALEVGFGGNTPEGWLMHTMSSLRSVCDVLLAYGVQVQDMSEPQAMKLLVEDAFETKDEAQRRWKQAQLADMELVSDFAVYSQIYDLREQLKRELNAQFDVARFNAQFVSYGGAPMAAIKDLMRPALLAQTTN